MQIPGGPRIYTRTLHVWAANRNWPALEVNTAAGKRWILLECGNVVTQTTKTPTRPDMKLTKTVNKATAKKGEKVTFTLKATNIGTATAKNILVYDDAPDGLQLLNDGLGEDTVKSSRRWETHKRFNVAPKQSFTYRISARATKWGPVVLTNRACVDFFDINIWNNCDTATVKIPQGCPLPGKDSLAKDDPQCKTNPGLEIEKIASSKDHKVGDTFDYTIKATNTGDVDLPKAVIRDLAPSEIEFIQVRQPGSNTFTPVKNKRDYVSGEFSLKRQASITVVLRAKVIKSSNQAVENTACILSTGEFSTAGACDDDTVTIKDVCPTNPSLANDSPECYPPCPVPGKENLPQNSPECRPCDETRQDDDKDVSCLELRKQARNITQGLNDANGSQAKAGDQIEYTLSVTNRSKETRENFVIEENLEDVLEYADLMDASGATFSESPVRMLAWDPIDIRPNETVNRTILIKVKSPIPSTPASTSDPYSYDLKMTNVYGNTVQINLPKHPVKTIERTITQLPNTGLGTNVAIGALLLGIAAYFYYRSRLLVKEVGLIKQQFNYAAGA